MRIWLFIVVLFVLLTTGFLIGTAIADAVPETTAVITATEQPAEPFVVDWRNLQGDTLYLLNADTLAVGIGTTIATFYDVVELRVEYAYAFQQAEDTRSLAGIGLGLNVPSLIETLHGEWKLPDIVPSVGLLALVDFADKPTIEVAFYLTIFRQSF